MTRTVPLLLALTATLAAPLTACGRPGPIRPPGPPEAIIYPRVYPYERPAAPAATSPVPSPATTR